MNTFLSHVELCFINFPSVARSSAKSLRYDAHALECLVSVRVGESQAAMEDRVFGDVFEGWVND